MASVFLVSSFSTHSGPGSGKYPGDSDGRVLWENLPESLSLRGAEEGLFMHPVGFSREPGRRGLMFRVGEPRRVKGQKPQKIR